MNTKSAHTHHTVLVTGHTKRKSESCFTLERAHETSHHKTNTHKIRTIMSRIRPFVPHKRWSQFREKERKKTLVQSSTTRTKVKHFYQKPKRTQSEKKQKRAHRRREEFVRGKKKRNWHQVTNKSATKRLSF